MSIRKRIFLTLFPLVLLSFSGIWAQSAFVPDLSMNLEDFEEKALEEKEEIWVVDFWASWCRPCIMSLPHLKEVREKYRDENVRFISISWDDNKSSWENAVNRFELDWNMILIPDVRAEHPFLDKHFPHKGIPTAFVISPSGKVKKVSDVYDLEKYIEKAK